MRIQSGETLNSSGFTLVELAIVLVIVGLLIGVGSGMMGVLSTAIKVRQTKDSLDDNMQAVASWASANNRLPKLSEFNSGTPVAKTQMDSWAHPFVFLYYSSLAPNTATKDTICGRRSTPLTVTSSNPTTTISNVAYAILSGGDSGASTLNSTLNGSLLGVAFNAAIPRLPSSNISVGGIATGTITIDPVNNDIVRWVTLDELRSKVGCQGAPLKIVNNELPFGAAPNSYSATISADGGVPFSSGGAYKWCAEFATPRTGIVVFDTSPVTGKINTSGTACNLLTEASTYFYQGDTLALTKKTGFVNFSTGSYKLTITVRDAAGNDTNACTSTTDNCVQKPFVLTINPN